MSKKITENIINLIKLNSISEYKLCNIIGLNQSSFSISKKKDRWSLDTIIKISQYFNEPIDRIVGINDFPPNNFKDENEKKKIFIVRSFGLINEGDIQSSKGNFNEALECYKIALRYIENADRDFNLESIIKEINIPYLDLRDKTLFDPTICLFRIATTYFKYSHDWKSAKDYYYRYKEISEKKNNLSNVAFALAGLAACEKNLGNYQISLKVNLNAIEYKEKIVEHLLNVNSLDNAKLIDAERSLANSYSNISTAYFELGSYNKAIDYSQKAIAIFKKNKIVPEVAVAMNNLANAYSVIGKYENALSIYKNIQNILNNYLESDNLNDPAKNSLALSVLANSLENSGNVLRNLNKLKDAGNKYFEALELKKKLGYPELLINSYTNLGDYYIRLNRPDEALKYTKEAIKLCEVIKNKFAMIYSLNNLGHICLLNKDFDKAISIYKSSLEIREEIGNSLLISINLKYLGDAYRLINNYSQSTEYYKFAIQYKKKSATKFSNNIDIKTEFCPLDDVFSREIGKFLKSGKIIEAFDFANENGESIKEVINKVTNNIHSISTGFVEEYNLNYIELNNMYSQLMLSSNAEDSRKIKYQIEEKTQVLHDLLNQNIKQRKVNNQNYFNEDIKCIYKLSFEDVNLLAA